MGLIAVSGNRGNIGRAMERAAAAPSADQSERSLEGVLDRNWSLGFEEDESSCNLEESLSKYLILREIKIFHNIPYANPIFRAQPTC